jgi:hypothetical protein
MYPTHRKGLLGELEFILHFIKKGYTVLTPVNPNSSYDMVIEKDGKFQRIQIKYCTPTHGVLRVELERPKRTTLPYKDRGVDAIGVYEATHEKFYLIPIEKAVTKSEFWLRVEDTKNSQKKHIHLASDFEI